MNEAASKLDDASIAIDAKATLRGGDAKLFHGNGLARRIQPQT
jgi:hypothetical protein